eukprot:UC1_evm2s1078
MNASTESLRVPEVGVSTPGGGDNGKVSTAVSAAASNVVQEQEQEQQQQQQRQPIDYEVRVITGKVKGAGTDANVYIDITGQYGDTGARKLAKSSTHRDKFEKGHTDVFTVEAVDLGELTSLRIWHDNKGLLGGAPWFLERVIVLHPGTQTETTFECAQWLSRKHDDKQIERTLVPSGASA